MKPCPKSTIILLYLRYLNTGYLWDTVRVMGGAYGCSGSFGAASGRYIFSSYRDPNVLSTLQAYDKGSDSIFADCETLTDSDVLEAIIGSIGDLDSPQSPDQKGYTGLIQFLSGSTPADRQQWRDEVLATRVDDFKAFGDRLSTLKEKSSIIVFGGRPALDAANSLLDEGQKLVLEHALRSSSAVDAT